jgi:hypothetical protein
LAYTYFKQRHSGSRKVEHRRWLLLKKQRVMCAYAPRKVEQA